MFCFQMIKVIRRKVLSAQKAKIPFILICIGLLNIFVFMTCFLPKAYAMKNKLDNKSITRAVGVDLRLDEGVSAHLIDVSAKDGVVTLSGSVDNILSKERAKKIAESIKGVRTVINLIEVKPIIRPDSEIRKDIVTALAVDPATDAYELKVKSENGTVTLSGIVESWPEKQLSEIVAKGVRGVKDIRNKIKVNYKNNRPDYEIKAEVEHLLKLDPYVTDVLIEVKANNGKVILTGTVGSASEKSYAYIDARKAGAVSVDIDGLETKEWVYDKYRRQEKFVVKSDQEIEKAVEDAFVYDPRVWSFDVDAEVKNGTVTLTGTVNNLKAKHSAEADALNTMGVTRVKNYLKVRPIKPPSDKKIAQYVEEAFGRDPFVNRHKIDVIVQNQKVYLYGIMDSYYEKLRAKSIASRILGVAEVENHIKVRYDWPRKNDQVIKEEIKDQFFWSFYVDSQDISVKVKDGTSILTGVVDDMQELDAAVKNAFEGGAKKVVSRLTVKEAPYYYPEYYTYEKSLISN